MPDAFGIEGLLAEFQEEAEDHFQVLNHDLLEIEERLAAREALPEKVLDEMFRAVHTIKGLSAMFDLPEVKDLAHAIEGVFDRMRKKALEVDAECLDVLFRSIDVLQRGVRGAGTGADAVDTRAECETLRALMEGGDATEAAKPAVRHADELTEYARKRIADAPGEGLRVVRIGLRWGIELRVGALTRHDVEVALGPAGELLEIRPLVDEIPVLPDVDAVNGDVAFEVLAVADADDQEIADRIGVSKSAVRTVAAPSAKTRPDDEEAQGRAGKGPGRRGASAGVVRVGLERLDSLVDLAGEIVTARTRLRALTAQLVRESPKEATTIALQGAVKDVSSLVDTLQDDILSLRMVPISQLFSRFPRAVRDIARVSGKSIELRTSGEDTELDKRVVEQVEDALLHVIRNACDHGVEPPEGREAAGKPPTGVISLDARQEGNHVVIEVGDDGRGLDFAKIRRRAEERGVLPPGSELDEDLATEIIMGAGFSTAETVTDVSGRGVGLDVVKRRTVELGGEVTVSSEPGKGTTFTLRIPLTLAIMPALLVKADGRAYAIPLAAVSSVVRARGREIHSVNGSAVLDLRSETLPVAKLAALFGSDGERDIDATRRWFIVEVAAAGTRFGLVVDRLDGQQDIVVKSLEDALGEAPGISGATILGDGSVVPIVDVDRVMRLMAHERRRVAAVDEEQR